MKSQYILPVAIVIFGLIVAGALFLVGHKPATDTGGDNKQAVAAVTDADHIFGNPNAAVKIVEYADLECPYCKQFHETMHQVMDFYGPSGNVAWVYRPFPLAQIHSKAPVEAQAAECAAEQGGSDAFFKYIDRVYEVTPSENGLDLNQLPVIAEGVGLDRKAFESCLASNKYAKKIQDAYAQALREGATGTPHIILMANNSSVGTLDGNQPYASMRSAVDEILSSLGLSGSGATASSTGSTVPAGTGSQPSPSGAMPTIERSQSGQTQLPGGVPNGQ
jgi:protein-disulfide isomerase